MSTKEKKKKNPSHASVENGIQIIKTAIRKKTSLGMAAKMHKRGRNYVPQIKLTIDENFAKKNITRDLYREFNATLKQFNKASK
ncbi:MAG: hypothetical protein AABY15_01635 [Nanoarchaeota archaeon]